MVNDLGFTINNCKLNFHHQQLQIRLLAFDFPLHICIEEMRNMMKCSYTKEGKKSNHLVQGDKCKMNALSQEDKDELQMKKGC